VSQALYTRNFQWYNKNLPFFVPKASV